MRFPLRAGVGLATGDPIGDPASFDASVANFVAHLRTVGLAPGRPRCPEESREIYERHGLRAMYVGDEAIIDVDPFNLDGRRMRNARQAVARTEHSGVTTEFHREGDLSTRLRDELLAVAQAHHAPSREFGFSMALGGLLSGDYPDCLGRRRRGRVPADRSPSSGTSIAGRAARSLLDGVRRASACSERGERTHDRRYRCLGPRARHQGDVIELRPRSARCSTAPASSPGRKRPGPGCSAPDGGGRFGIQMDTLGRFNAKFAPAGSCYLVYRYPQAPRRRSAWPRSAPKVSYRSRTRPATPAAPGGRRTIHGHPLTHDLESHRAHLGLLSSSTVSGCTRRVGTPGSTSSARPATRRSHLAGPVTRRRSRPPGPIRTRSPTTASTTSPTTTAASSTRSTSRPSSSATLFGGLINEKLLGQGVGAGAIAIDPAQIKGVRLLPLAQLRAALPALGNPANLHRSVSLTEKEFKFGFGNALTDEESSQLFSQWTILSPARPLFQAAAANFSLHSEAKVDTANSTRGPLLLISGTADHGAGRDHPVDPSPVPALQRGDRAQAVRGSGVISLTFDHGWREVADACVEWLRSKNLLNAGCEAVATIGLRSSTIWPRSPGLRRGIISINTWKRQVGPADPGVTNSPRRAGAGAGKCRWG